MLIANHISKSFRGKPILKDVSIQIHPGKITVLIGPSGAGKTTFLRALAFVDLPDEGQIQFDEKIWRFPVSYEDASGKADQNPTQFPWPKLTVVFQQLFLWPHLTLKENILLPARNIPNPHLEEDFEELIRSLHMESFIDRYPNEASLGQRQRVALARAIILKPECILMDEITSALDVEQIHEIVQFLPKLKEKGIGMLLITHLLNFAKHTADHVVFLDDGKIVEEGTVDILSHPQTERLGKFLSLIEKSC